MGKNIEEGLTKSISSLISNDDDVGQKFSHMVVSKEAKTLNFTE
jgi:hypothetical protein